MRPSALDDADREQDGQVRGTDTTTAAPLSRKRCGRIGTRLPRPKAAPMTSAPCIGEPYGSSTARLSSFSTIVLSSTSGWLGHDRATSRASSGGRPSSSNM